MIDSTAIYISANVEDEAFEHKMRLYLQCSCNGLPIISVTRKSINLGLNICVGKKPVSYRNAFRQLLIGLRTATTKYCHAAISDFLYPPEYFMFQPFTDDGYFKYTNVWILHGWVGKNTGTGYWQKHNPDGAMACNRLCWIAHLEKCFKDDDWNDPTDPPEPFATEALYSWSTPNPVISIKTDKQLNKYTSIEKYTVESLPYWGEAIALRKELLGV